MSAPASRMTSAASARTDRATAGRPRLRAVVRHLGLSLLVGTIVPSVLFYVCLVAANVWTALIVALAWCYGSLAWRLRSRRPTSVLLWLAVVGLTGKTVVTFLTGSTMVYFLQPAVGDAIVAVAFLVSLATARPAVARLAGEFYPMTREVASRPQVQRLFTRLTLLWGCITAAKAGVTLWLLQSLSLTSFVVAKTVLTPSVAVVGAAVTVTFAVRVARREGLLSGSGPLAVSAAL
jgi:hypothetical protein